MEKVGFKHSEKVLVALRGVYNLPFNLDDPVDILRYCHIIPFPAGSIYLTVAITIERYFTVCHPYFMVSALYSQAAGYLLLMAALTGN